MFSSYVCMCLTFATSAALEEGNEKAEAMRELAWRLDVLYQKQLQTPGVFVKEEDGLHFMITSDTFACGGDGVPISYMMFEVAGVRPVDYFNFKLGYSFYNYSGSKLLVDDHVRPAQGWAVETVLPVVPATHSVQWLYVKANFTTEEFWLVTTNYNSEELQVLSPAPSGETGGDNCFMGYRFTRTADGNGVQVHSTQHFNAHQILSVADLSKLAWRTGQIQSGNNGEIQKAKQQSAKHWNSSRVLAPHWMFLDDAACNLASAATRGNKRKAALKQARAALDYVTTLPQQPARELPSDAGGGLLRLHAGHLPWGCGGSRGSRNEVAALADFVLPTVDAGVVANVFVDENASAWAHVVVPQVTPTPVVDSQFSAILLHEELVVPKAAPFLFQTAVTKPRETFSWQAALHNFTEQNYLIAKLGTDVIPPNTTSIAGSEYAALCAEGYSVRALPGGHGSQIQMVKSVNWNLTSFSRWLLDKSGDLEKVAVETVALLAQGVATEAVRRQKARGAGASTALTSAGALWLLAGPSPNFTRNVSRTTSAASRSAKAAARLDLTLVETRQESFLTGFAGSDLLAALSYYRFIEAKKQMAWTNTTRRVEMLYHRLRATRNISEEAINWWQNHSDLAKDDVELQYKIEWLREAQTIVWNTVECDSAPDMHHHQNPSGGWLSFSALIMLGVAALLCLCSCCSLILWRCCCPKCQCCRRNQGRDTANGLLANPAGNSSG